MFNISFAILSWYRNNYNNNDDSYINIVIVVVVIASKKMKENIVVIINYIQVDLKITIASSLCSIYKTCNVYAYNKTESKEEEH